MSVRFRSAIGAISCAALLVGPFQVTAGAASLPKETYDCYKETTTGWTHTGWELTIVDNERYEYSDGETVESGKYRKGKGKKLFFSSGYLKKKGFKGKHYPQSDHHNIELIKKSRASGKPTSTCASPVLD